MFSGTAKNWAHKFVSSDSKNLKFIGGVLELKYLYPNSKKLIMFLPFLNSKWQALFKNKSNTIKILDNLSSNWFPELIKSFILDVRNSNL